MVAKKKKTPNFLGNLKEGGLHSQLGYKQSAKIPSGVINKIVSADVGDTVSVNGESVKVTGLLKKRAQFTKTAATWKK